MKIYAFADEASPEIDLQIAALKRNSLDGLEIRNVDGVNISEITVEKAKEVIQKLDSNGLSVWSIGSPVGKSEIEAQDFNEQLDKVKHTLEVASILKAENIRIFSFYIPQGANAGDYKNEVVERLGKICELCSEYGITPCHENEKGIFGDTAERCSELFKAITDLKGIFDPANFVQCGVNTLNAWEMLKNNIKYLHIKDSTSGGDIVPAGEGDGQIPYIIKDFAAMGGENVTLEPHLTVFDGLAGLERAGEKSNIGNKYTFDSPDDAFDTAANSLKNILL